MTRALERLVARLLVIVAVGFIGIPIIAIFLRVSLASMLDGLTSEAAREALALSFKTTLISLGVILVVGTPVAYVLVTRPIRGRDAITTLLELPLVMPPAVAGIALLSAFGARGAIGGPLGLESALHDGCRDPGADLRRQPVLPPSGTGCVRGDRGRDARGRARVWRVANADTRPDRRTARRRGTSDGCRPAWARALGEFGATLIFAGSFQGVTQTAPLAIYGELDNDIPAALGLSAVLCPDLVRGLDQCQDWRETMDTALVARVRVALRDFTLDAEVAVGPAETLAIAGLSGAGKTTLVRALAGTRATG